jgi:spermidine synthase
MAAVPPPARPVAPPGSHVVFSAESPYAHVEVIETRRGERYLRVNEGYAVQSYAPANGGLPLEGPWGFYAAAPAFGAREPRRALFLGMGGGSAVHAWRHLYPQVVLTGVEIDPVVVRAGREALGFPLSGVEVVVADARPFVEAAVARGTSWDVVVIDAVQFPYVPFHLATTEFFGAVAKCVAEGGAVVMNVGRHGEDDAVVDAIARTAATAFPHVRRADLANGVNSLLVATHHAPAEDLGFARLPVTPQHAAELARVAARMPQARRATWSPTTPVLTDDRAPVEWLTDRTVLRALRGTRAPPGGG